VLAMPPQDAPLPDWLTSFKHFMMATLTNEIGFYTAHRIFHEVPGLYRFHKQHHRYIGTIAIAAEFATPPEELIANFLPSFGYCLYAGVPNPILLVWMLQRLFETYESHSGYCFKGSILSRVGLLNAHRAEFHDFHHTVNKGNYGTHLFLDHLLQTMTPFLESNLKSDANSG
jgi:methylsterol monooxygenase